MAAAAVETNAAGPAMVPAVAAGQPNDSSSKGCHSHGHGHGWWWGRRGWEQDKQDGMHTSHAAASSSELLTDQQTAAVGNGTAVPDAMTQPQDGLGHHHHHHCPFQKRYPLEEIAEGQIHLLPDLAYYGPRGYDIYGPHRSWRQLFYSETGHLFGEFDF